jgi:hypothetical protein
MRLTTAKGSDRQAYVVLDAGKNIAQAYL